LDYLSTEVMKCSKWPSNGCLSASQSTQEECDPKTNSHGARNDLKKNKEWLYLTHLMAFA